MWSPYNMDSTWVGMSLGSARKEKERRPEESTHEFPFIPLLKSEYAGFPLQAAPVRLLTKDIQVVGECFNWRMLHRRIGCTRSWKEQYGIRIRTTRTSPRALHLGGNRTPGKRLNAARALADASLVYPYLAFFIYAQSSY